MSETRISLLYSFTEKYLLLAIATAGTMVLARLLTPQETGIYSVAAVLVGVAQVVRDFGVGQYVIQAPASDPATLRAVLGTSYLLSALLGVLTALLSGPVAAFYGEPGLAGVMRILSINFLLIPLTSVTLPLLRREMRFGAVCAINLASGSCAMAVSVVLAWQGFSYESMAWGALAGAAAGVAASLPLRPRGMPWLPSLRGARKVFSFGAYATGGTLVDEAAVAAPDLIIGKMIGMEGAGLFGKAQSVLAVFRQAVLGAVSPVLLPLYAARAREAGGANAAFLATVSYLTACAWPFFAFIGIAALPLVRLLYGDQWDRAAHLIRIMCVATTLYSMGMMSRYLFVATGQVRLQARLDTVSSLVRVAILLVAAGGGLTAAAWAVVASAVQRTWLTCRYLEKAAGIGPAELARACARSAGITLATGAAAQGAMLASAGGPYALGATASAAAVAWLLSLVALRHPLRGDLVLAWRRLAAVLAR